MRIRAKLVHKLVECGALRQVAQQAATAIRGSICKFRVNKALRLKTCVNMLQNLQQLQKQTIFWYDLSSLKYVVCAFLYAPWLGLTAFSNLPVVLAHANNFVMC